QFKIHTKSENEKKRVLYTYDVDNIVDKYEDVAFLNYRFFDEDNESDLHNLYIRYRFPDSLVQKDHAYLHDYTGEAELDKNVDEFVYHIETLPAKETTETHFLLDPSMFAEKTVDARGETYQSLKQ